MKDKEFILSDGKIHLVKKEVISSITYEQFAKELVKNDFTMETKQLPVNCLKYTVTDKVEQYIQFIPEDNYRLNYKGKLYVVRLPNTIITFTFDRDSNYLMNSPIMLWTMDKEIDLEKSKFFIPLLHNIYPDGRVCEGVSVRAETQREYINQYLTNLFTTEYNDDLSSGKRYMNKVCKDQHRFLPYSEDEHDLIQCWWKPIIEQDDGYKFGAPISEIHPKPLRSFL